MRRYICKYTLIINNVFIIYNNIILRFVTALSYQSNRLNIMQCKFQIKIQIKIYMSSLLILSCIHRYFHFVIQLLNINLKFRFVYHISHICWWNISTTIIYLPIYLSIYLFFICVLKSLPQVILVDSHLLGYVFS